jgi:hypothetical protein
MHAVPTISRPELTLPEADGTHLRAACANATAILEYRADGATVMAADMPGKRVWLVESDADRVHMMRGSFDAHPPAHGSEVEVIHADIGATRQWGHPRGRGGYLRYARYPLGPWERGDIVPDLAVVDGRFRTVCALAAELHTAAPDDRVHGRIRDRADGVAAIVAQRCHRDDAAALGPRNTGRTRNA